MHEVKIKSCSSEQRPGGSEREVYLSVTLIGIGYADEMCMFSVLKVEKHFVLSVRSITKQFATSIAAQARIVSGNCAGHMQ